MLRQKMSHQFRIWQPGALLIDSVARTYPVSKTVHFNHSILQRIDFFAIDLVSADMQNRATGREDRLAVHPCELRSAKQLMMIPQVVVELKLDERAAGKKEEP